MLTRKKQRTAKIGLFCVGHATYWPQFDGLLESLLAYHVQVKEMIIKQDVEIFDYGMVDSSEKAYETVKKINRNQVDLLFCNMATYATSSTFAPVIKNVNMPVVLLSLQPLEHLDYNKVCTYMQLQNDNICAVPEFVCTAERMGKQISDVIIGTLNHDAEAEQDIAEWCDIAKVLHDLKGARIGLMGHVMESMYDMHTDPVAISSAFNLHVPLLEIEDLLALYNQVTDCEVQKKIDVIKQNFLMPEPKQDPITAKVSEADLYESAKSAVALDMLVEKYHLTGLAYYYEGLEDSPQRRMISSLIVGNSMLNAQGIPMCGELDLKTCIAMLIFDRLDIGGSFAEFHPFDFKENYILVGHDGPHHLKVAEGKPILRSLKKYHGKPGSGISVEFKLKEGPITMLGITQKADGSYKFVLGEGLSQKGAIPPTGNTNTRGVFEPDTKSFIKSWVMEAPTHHYALGIGHHAKTVEKIGKVLGIETVLVK